jgi:nitroreductase
MLDFIYKRRSIRKYTEQPVEDEKITEMLKAAMAAPSANNKQPWHFVVIKSRETLDKIAEAHPHAKMAAGAPLAIVVCGDADNYYLWQDCAASTQNLLLAAANIGLGAVWCGLREEREISMRNILDVPDHIRTFSLVVIGYPGEEKPARTQYKEDKVHYEGW